MKGGRGEVGMVIDSARCGLARATSCMGSGGACPADVGRSCGVMVVLEHSLSLEVGKFTAELLSPFLVGVVVPFELFQLAVHLSPVCVGIALLLVAGVVLPFGARVSSFKTDAIGKLSLSERATAGAGGMTETTKGLVEPEEGKETQEEEGREQGAEGVERAGERSQPATERGGTHALASMEAAVAVAGTLTAGAGELTAAGRREAALPAGDGSRVTGQVGGEVDAQEEGEEPGKRGQPNERVNIGEGREVEPKRRKGVHRDVGDPGVKAPKSRPQGGGEGGPQRGKQEPTECPEHKADSKKGSKPKGWWMGTVPGRGIIQSFKTSKVGRRTGRTGSGGRCGCGWGPGGGGRTATSRNGSRVGVSAMGVRPATTVGAPVPVLARTVDSGRRARRRRSLLPSLRDH